MPNHKRFLSRRTLLLPLLMACATADEPPTGGDVPLVILPSRLMAGPSATVQFQAYLDEQPVPTDQVTWSLADTSFGQIDASGLLKVVACLDGGPSTIGATLKRNPAQHGTAAITFVVPAVALVQIQAITRAQDHQPVDLERVGGSVEVAIRSAELCGEIASVDLIITGATGRLRVPGQVFVPPTTSPVTALLLWDTAALINGRSAFPDGDYTVTALLRTVGGFGIPSNAIPLRVANH